MINIRYLQKAYVVILLLSVCVGGYSADSIQTTYDSKAVNKEINMVLNAIQASPEQSSIELNDFYELGLEQNDTSLVIKSLIGLSDIDRFGGNYDLSFENLWEALLLAEEQHNTYKLIHIHRNLGLLYQIFNKDSLAIDHLHNAIELVGKSGISDLSKKDELRATYFAIANLYRDRELYYQSLAYLDSCEALTPWKYMSYVSADRGFILTKIGNYDLAYDLISKASQHFKVRREHYYVMTLMFMGELKAATNELDSARYYYSKCLTEIDKRNAHVAIKPDVQQKLSKVFYDLGNYRKAYQYLEASKNSFEELYAANNKRNTRLFEMKNSYRESLEKKQALIDAQETMLKQKSILQQRLIGLLVLIMLVGVGIVIYSRMHGKLKKVALAGEMEKEKQNAIIDFKGKELTSYTLQIIEKEKTVNELLDVIKEISPGKHKMYKNQYVTQNQNLWEEFNMRFLEINGEFYDRLRQKHPELTSTEHKHCALIKLNFDSPEMARVLNISLQSVHTSRYRIRKKIGLEHEDSLENYIGGL